MRSSLAFLAALLLAGCMTMPAGPLTPGLHSEAFGETSPMRARTLLVVLHDDGKPDARSDSYVFAARAAGAIPSSVAIALLRPGYGDARGNASPGDRGKDTGDNYTADRIAAVGDAVARLRRIYPRARTILVGEGGGAAIAADVTALRPGLVDGMVLVSCPCTLPEWRRYMQRRNPAQPWDAAAASLDPLQTAGGLTPGLRAAILVGANDPVTPPKFARPYAEALALRGIDTDYRILPDGGHAILNDPEVLAATARLAASLPGKH